MCVMSSDLGDTNNNEKTCAGELKTIRKMFSMGYLMILIQIKVILNQNIKTKTILVSDRPVTRDYDNQAPSPRKGLKLIRQQEVQQPNASHQPLVNKNNGNGAERGFEWEHYNFEDPHNPESDQIFRNHIIYRLHNHLL